MQIQQIQPIHQIRLGYACINETLSKGTKGKKDTQVSCNKTCRLATVIAEGDKTETVPQSEIYSTAIYNFLIDYGIRNLKAVHKILVWNKDHDIYFYRMSSDMFPHIGNLQIKNLLNDTHWQNYNNLHFVESLIYEIGSYAQKYNIRLSMHPDHYNQMASPNSSVLEKTLIDLAWHTRLLDLLQIGADNYIQYKYPDTNQNTNKDTNQNTHIRNVCIDSTLCLHGGGTYKDKVSSIQRWKTFYLSLPLNIQKRICLENCEKSYSAEDLLSICEELNIPLIFDFHHYACWANYHPDNPDQPAISELLPRIVATWNRRKIRPKFHLSDQAADKRVGAHHDYVQEIPIELLTLSLSQSIDVMIEAKAKEAAVFHLKKKYNV